MASKPYNKLDATCAGTILTQDYGPLLNATSARYYDRTPSVEAPVGTQAANFQVPYAFTSNGGEYRDNSYWMGEFTPTYYTQSGFVPGKFMPNASYLAPRVADDPVILNFLATPGIAYTTSLTTQEAADLGYKQAYNYIDRFIDHELSDAFTPTCNYCKCLDKGPCIFPDPYKSCAPEYALQIGALYQNPLHYDCLYRGKAVAGEAGGNMALPAGIRKLIMDNKVNQRAWEVANNKGMTMQNRIGEQMRNSALNIATARAQALTPINRFLSGPISEGLNSDVGTPVEEFSFFRPEFTFPEQFANQQHVRMTSLIP